MRQLFKVESNGTIVMTGQHFDSPSDLARQAAYKVYYLPDSNQETLLSSMLESRHNLATLCGYRFVRTYEKERQVLKNYLLQDFQ